MHSNKKEEFEMFLLFEMTPDLVCIAGKDGYFRKINRAVIETLEYTEEELFAKPIATFIHPKDKELTHHERTKLLAGKTLVNFENRYVSKTGKIIWLHWTSIYLPEKEVVFAIAKDVTTKKQAEREIEEKYIKFKGLANHFKSSIEKDKKYFAVELHEELAQLASVIKMEIEWVNDSVPDPSHDFQKRINHVSAITDLLINTIRRLSFSLSPNMLDDVGLVETLKWLCNEFTVMNGIPCQFESAYEEVNLTHEMQLDFFRICQEALNNIKHHTRATKVKVCIEEDEEKISLFIIDNDKTQMDARQTLTHGLSNIRERAASINAELIIKSEVDKGTKVIVTIPKLVTQKV
jgi:PAS domain S-box-containing protein